MSLRPWTENDPTDAGVDQSLDSVLRLAPPATRTSSAESRAILGNERIVRSRPGRGVGVVKMDLLEPNWPSAHDADRVAKRHPRDRDDCSWPRPGLDTRAMRATPQLGMTIIPLSKEPLSGSGSTAGNRRITCTDLPARTACVARDELCE